MTQFLVWVAYILLWLTAILSFFSNFDMLHFSSFYAGKQVPPISYHPLQMCSCLTDFSWRNLLTSIGDIGIKEFHCSCFSRAEKYIVFLLQSCRPPSIFHNAYGFSIWVIFIPLSLNPLELFPNEAAVCCFSKLTTNLKLLYLILWVHLGFSSKW